MMQLVIEQKDDLYVGTDLQSGWRIEYVHDRQTCAGVYPYLAFKEALYVLKQYEQGLLGKPEDFQRVFDYMWSIWDKDAFKIPLVSFNAVAPHLHVRVLAITDGEELPGCLHSIAVSIQESNNYTPVHSSSVRFHLSLLKHDGAVRDVKIGQVNHQDHSPIALGHPQRDFGVRASVTLEDDGKTVKSIHGPITFNLIG